MSAKAKDVGFWRCRRVVRMLEWELAQPLNKLHLQNVALTGGNTLQTPIHSHNRRHFCT